MDIEVEMTRKKKVIILLTSILIVLLSVTLMARYKMPHVIQNLIESRLSDRGWIAKIRATAWNPMNPFTVNLKDLTLQKEGCNIRASEVTIETNAFLSPQKVLLKNGSIALDETRQSKVRPGKKTWNERMTSLQGQNIDISWKSRGQWRSKVLLMGSSFVIGDVCKIKAPKASITCFGTSASAKGVTIDCADRWASAKSASLKWKAKEANLTDVKVSKAGRSVKLTIRRSHVKEIDIESMTATMTAESLDPVKVRSSISISSASAEHRRISARQITVRDVQIDATYVGDRNFQKFALTANPIRIQKVPIYASVHRRADGWSVKVDMDPVPCQDLLDSIPDGMADELSNMKVEGDLNGKLKVVKERKSLEVDVSFQNECSITSIPKRLLPPLRGRRFTRTIYGPDGSPRNAEGGPGSSEWTSLANVSPYVTMSVITTEDPSFQSNDGFDMLAIENSIRDNIKEKRFKRGASTISMQLAKNLWLKREKTVSRKIQEAFLTVLIEQELSKSKIMELYLNCVEFGPNMYGIGRAAKHYFDSTPRNLTFAQSVFLASILPNPNRTYFNANGTLHRGRQHYIGLIMDLMFRRGMIMNEELNEGKREIVKKGGKSSHRKADTSGWDVNL